MQEEKGYYPLNPTAPLVWDGRLPSEGIPDPSARPEPSLTSVEALVRGAGRDLLTGFDVNPVPGVMGSPNSPTPRVDNYAINLVRTVMAANDGGEYE